LDAGSASRHLIAVLVAGMAVAIRGKHWTGTGRATPVAVPVCGPQAADDWRRGILRDGPAGVVSLGGGLRAPAGPSSESARK